MIFKTLKVILIVPMALLFICLKYIAEWTNYRYSKVGTNGFLDNEQFEWVKYIEPHWEEVNDELKRLLETDDQPSEAQSMDKARNQLASDSQWRTFFFRAYGNEIVQNCLACPRTAELIQTIPGARTAYFSLLSAGEHVSSHKGPYNGLLRYQLGLQVPGDGELCKIKVGEEERYWQDGKSLVYDDRFEHEVSNDSALGVRAVLSVDFVRPLPVPASWLNWIVIHIVAFLPPVKNGLINTDEWNKNLAID